MIILFVGSHSHISRSVSFSERHESSSLPCAAGSSVGTRSDYVQAPVVGLFYKFGDLEYFMFS